MVIWNRFAALNVAGKTYTHASSIDMNDKQIVLYTLTYNNFKCRVKKTFVLWISFQTLQSYEFLSVPHLYIRALEHMRTCHVSVVLISLLLYT